MIEVVLINIRAPRILEIVSELRELGMNEDDFEFAYHKAIWDGISSWDEYEHHRTSFKFSNEATATWFALKYKK